MDFRRPLLRVPNLAIHLNRNVNTEGLKLNAQEHMVPVLGLESAGPAELRRPARARAGRRRACAPSAGDILGYDLALYDTQPSTRSGAHGEFLHAPRLDNLASCYAGLSALLAADKAGEATRGVVLYDHEEVGSRSAQGAAGTFLRDCLERLVLGHSDGRPDAFHRAIRALVPGLRGHGARHPPQLRRRSTSPGTSR